MPPRLKNPWSGVGLFLWLCLFTTHASAQTFPISEQQPELQSILDRLEQQDAELRALRASLEQTQAAAQANLMQSKAASEPAASAQEYEVGSDNAMTATWNPRGGLEFKNKGGDFRMHIGGAVNFDFNSFGIDPWIEAPRAVGGIGPSPDSMQLRRGRITFDGTFYEVFDFKMEYEFANFLTAATPTVQAPVANSPGFTDFYLSWKNLPILGNVRVGNQKEPLGMEHLMSFKFTSFSERSYLQDIVFGPFNNGFNPGILTFNSSDDQRLTWAIGGYGNNSNPWAYSVGDDWALTGRTTYLLYYDEPSDGRYLWEVGISGSYRTPDEDIVRLRARNNVRSGPPGALNPIVADTGDLHAERQEILALESAVQWGPWSMEAEYVGTWINDAFAPYDPPADRVSRGTPFFQGGYVSLLYMFTGEHRTFNRQLAVFDRVKTFSGSIPTAGAAMAWAPGKSGCAIRPST
jgi:phosphate-selective porin OprO/OprP